MKAISTLLLLNFLTIGLLPHAAFSQNQITPRVNDECKRCWVNNETSDVNSLCRSACSDSCNDTVEQGRPQNGQVNCRDLDKLMEQYQTKALQCTKRRPNEMENACSHAQLNLAISHIDAAKRAHDRCEQTSPEFTAFNELDCVKTYYSCKLECETERVHYRVSGNYTIYANMIAEHSTQAFERGCAQKWSTPVDRINSFESLLTNYNAHKRQALAQQQCQQPSPPTPDPPANPPDDDKEKDKEEKEKTNTNPVTQGMNTVNQLAQMAQPFLMPPTTNYAPGTDYSVAKPIEQYGAQPYRSAFDSPDYFNTGNTGEMDFDEPFLDEGGNGQGANFKNFNNNQGGAAPRGGQGGSMMAGGMMGQAPSGGTPPASSGRTVRRPKKKDKTLYSSRSEGEGSSGSILSNDPAQPGTVTKQVARKVGFDQNGQQLDASFDPSKYAPKINDVYNRAINSSAMQKAMRRAAGFETMTSQNSRGYTNWHTTHHIHPGQLSIFKQVRICYIMKYSSSTGSCGSN
ncbi:MAG: hypothetical protein M9899_10000 [Bdellovibrionaceae bacterium]|nr:hypothetical protein [Pseudobdellovibrionaceae bacterium]